MNHNLEIVNSSLEQIQQPDFSYDEILERLIPAVNHLLDTDMNSLLNILYRIDVSESKVRDVMATSSPKEVGKQVSRLILNRQIEKIEMRKKYSS